MMQNFVIEIEISVIQQDARKSIQYAQSQFILYRQQVNVARKGKENGHKRGNITSIYRNWNPVAYRHEIVESAD